MVFFTELHAENIIDFDMHMRNLPKNELFQFFQNCRQTRADNFRAHCFSKLLLIYPDLDEICFMIFFHEKVHMIKFWCK